MSRYIDADKLLDRLSAYDTSDTIDKALYNFAHNQVITMPTADVKPVIHGKWKRKIVDNGFNADWICSECGYKVMTDFVNFKYCPNCGTDMREEDT